jgi:hypothetical protein
VGWTVELDLLNAILSCLALAGFIFYFLFFFLFLSKPDIRNLSPQLRNIAANQIDCGVAD